ncbi:eisosome protein SEG2-like [Trifolium pratense]|uniref:eisosome protein SEG2-like n=1 Tax=Trifolium pratense TaxID=57577 RepID=UPI001E694D86|nr:eisosome protein SEG2-like [Trifolium pratense]
MKKEANNNTNMKSHVKNQRGASSLELPQFKSSNELLAKRYKIKREEGMANLQQTNASITKVGAPSNKQNQPPTTQPFKLSMFATTAKTNLNSIKEPVTKPNPKKKISDNASRTQPNVIAERSVEKEVSMTKHKGLKIQDSKGQSLAQGRGPVPTQIQEPKEQPMKKTMIEDGSMERQQTGKNNYVGNGSLLDIVFMGHLLVRNENDHDQDDDDPQDDDNPQDDDDDAAYDQEDNLDCSQNDPQDDEFQDGDEDQY